jgi:hypothetical protein
MALLRILAGLSLLTLGRKLYWLFVAGIGFALAVNLTGRLLPELSQWLALLLSLAVGLLGALLAQWLQRFALTLAGIVGGALLAPPVVDLLGIEPVAPWLLAAIGALIGGALIVAAFEWALILLSALVGGALIAQGLPLERPMALVVWILSVAFGVVVQLNMWRLERR